MMFFHKKLEVLALVILANDLVSTHLVKQSIATIVKQALPLPFGIGPMILISIWQMAMG